MTVRICINLEKRFGRRYRIAFEADGKTKNQWPREEGATASRRQAFPTRRAFTAGLIGVPGPVEKGDPFGAFTETCPVRRT
jgi:hypothetical protein